MNDPYYAEIARRRKLPWSEWELAECINGWQPVDGDAPRYRIREDGFTEIEGLVSGGKPSMPQIRLPEEARGEAYYTFRYQIDKDGYVTVFDDDYRQR